MSQIKNKFLAQVPALTLKGNNTGSTANVTDLTVSQVNAMLGTLSSSLAQNHIFVGNGSAIATDVAMSGEASIVSSGAITLSNAAVIAKLLTGFTSGAGTVSSSDSILSAIQKIDGNEALDVRLDGSRTMTGDLNLGTHKVTGLVSGTTTGEALQWGQIGVANGIAGLDGGGKVPFSQLPSTLMIYLGAWNASTNTPTLADGTGANGDVYRVSVAGTQNLGSGSQTFFVGDFIIYNGTIWQRSPAADGVISVNGASGAVTVNAINQLTGDVTAGPASGSQSQAATVAKIQGTTVSGTTGTGNVVFSAAPTLTGLLSGGSASFSSTIAASNFSGSSSGTNTGDQTITLTGDVTGSGTGSFATTLATVNSNVGSFGGASSVPSFTVNAKGLITAASATAVVAPAGTLSGTTLNSTVVSSSLTSVGTIATGVWNGTAVDIAHGGTGQTSKAAAFDALSPMSAGGDIIYGGASGTGTRLANGSSGQVLTSNGGTSAPSWQSPAAAPINNKETFVLSGGDITNQYIDLAHVAKTSSINFDVVGGGEQVEGASYDYTVSYTGGAGGNTRITFVNGLATGGVSALVATDVVQIQYQY